VKSLTGRIKGQDSAVRKIAERLALTKSGLDLRPYRPDGVFLLVGPTGVGKTELANGEWELAITIAREMKNVPAEADALRGLSTTWLDAPGSYHNGACGLAFADGHSEVHKWQAKPVAGQEANLADWNWMAQRTSAKVVTSP